MELFDSCSRSHLFGVILSICLSKKKAEVNIEWHILVTCFDGYLGDCRHNNKKKKTTRQAFLSNAVVTG